MRLKITVGIAAVQWWTALQASFELDRRWMGVEWWNGGSFGWLDGWKEADGETIEDCDYVLPVCLAVRQYYPLTPSYISCFTYFFLMQDDVSKMRRTEV
jgi:hypothetical protein